ncbi:hypothetical protein [Paucihalobacter sp.]|uniref:hypothetical protein n=1 Tax=Paucihalobacter sp. TaxID=2850405 RepID=UPI002FE019C5
MDGNKKIRNILFAGLMALALTACMVQSHSYGGLYVETENSVSDTIRADKKIVDFESKTDSLKKMMRKSSDSLYQKRVEKSLSSISDSLQQLRFQITEIQNKQSTMADSSYVWSEQQKFQPKDSVQKVESFKTPAQIKTDSLNTQQIQRKKLETIDSVKHDTLKNRKETQTVKKTDNQSVIKSNQIIEDRYDSINAPKTQNRMVTKSSNQNLDTTKLDTTDNATEGQKLNQEDALRANNNNTHMLQTKNDTIVPIRSQMNELRNTDTIKTDTIFVARETAKSTLAENQHTDYRNQQQLRAKDDQIQSLQNQLNAQQNSNTRRPRRSFIFRDRTHRQPYNNQQSDQLSMQLIKEQNDTIQYLRSQLRSLQLEPQKRDSLDLKQQGMNVTPSSLGIDQQQTANPVRELQDTLKIFNARLLSLENVTLQAKDTSARTKQNQRNTAFNKKIDTTLLVAYYGKGDINPLDEVSIFNQIKDSTRNKKIRNIMLSGYTDSSGNARINKEITNKRLNYLSENITPWISKEKIFFQNFGDVFSSDQMITDERRIEIRILTE